MLEDSNTQKKRKELSEKTGISIESVIKLAKLSDIARVGGLRWTRALLYYDAGVDAFEEIAK